MGEIADAMLDGVLCQWCGEHIGNGEGFPGLCYGCTMEKEAADKLKKAKKKKKKRKAKGPRR